MSKKYQSFNIIRKAGDPTKVTLVTKDGKETTVYKSQDEKIFVQEYQTFIKCHEYGAHFVFELPSHIPGWAHMCSCGSPAILVGSKVYDHLGSAEGMMFSCQHHLDFNIHADGSQ